MGAIYTGVYYTGVRGCDKGMIPDTRAVIMRKSTSCRKPDKDDQCTIM